MTKVPQGRLKTVLFSRPYGTEPKWNLVPALKCRAISRLPLRGADNIRLPGDTTCIVPSTNDKKHFRARFIRQFTTAVYQRRIRHQSLKNQAPRSLVGCASQQSDGKITTYNLPQLASGALSGPKPDVGPCGACAA